MNQKAGQAECRIEGYDEFKLFAANTVYLESMKGVNEDQEQLRRILQGLQCEDNNASLDNVDIQRLLQLDIRDQKYTRKEQEEIQATSIYLYANKDPAVCGPPGLREDTQLSQNSPLVIQSLSGVPEALSR
jgi:hypothetical protein